MKPVIVFVLICVAVCLAVPIGNDESAVAPAELTFEGPSESLVESNSNSITELQRPKRFLLKKLVLAKAGLLGLG